MADTPLLEPRQSVEAPAHFADIVVLLDGTAEDENRLAHAEALAASHHSRIVGVVANLIPDPVAYSGEFGTVAIAELAEAMRREGDVTCKRLSGRLERLGVENELRRIDDFSAVLSNTMASKSRNADLFVASLPQGSDANLRWRPAIEQVLFETGRGVYLVPVGRPPRATLRTGLIGWSDTRKSARAVAEAMPLLLELGKVEIATVREPRKNRLGGTDPLSMWPRISHATAS